MDGPTYLPTGDVISSSLSMMELPHASNDLFDNYKVDVGQIIKIYAIDNPENTPEGEKASFLVYDVLIKKPNGSSDLLQRCRMMQPGFGGGLNNYLEVLPTDPGYQGKDPTIPRVDKRGHWVLVGYISGQKESGVILGGMPHLSPVAIKTRPTTDKGVYTVGEIQGLNFSVDNEGALKVVFNGPRDDQGNLINQNGPTVINFDANGSVNISTNKNQSILIDRTTGHIHITNGNTYMDMDQDADKIKIVAKNIETGTGDLQPQLVGNDWKSLMEELITEIMAIYVPTGIGPSGVPVNNPKFAAIKEKLKEALSTKHTVEK